MEVQFGTTRLFFQTCQQHRRSKTNSTKSKKMSIFPKQHSKNIPTWFAFSATSPFCIFLLLCFTSSIAITVYISLPNLNTSPIINGRFLESFSHDQSSTNSTTNQKHECDGRYIYIHKLPPRFNLDLLNNCRSLNPFTDEMCKQLENWGLGSLIKGSKKSLFKGSNGWYSTNQFSLEVIFHNRMKKYKCLTQDSTMASAVYVPFYAGLDVGRFLWGVNVTTRDALSLDIVNWLRSQPQWVPSQGANHFMVAGRVTWDFRRVTNSNSDWGNNLLFLPEINNMTSLVIESNRRHTREMAIPYPTYFHPSTQNEMIKWQRRIRRHKRPYLFSFAGAPRPEMTYSIRNQVINQCLGSSPKCKLLRCDQSSRSCERPSSVMRLFMSSVFCLQPPGDSYTRRSAFDSILGGCIPVFFHPESFYLQYSWHLPRDYASYSVLIRMEGVKSGNVSIQSELSRIPREQVEAMREEVIRLIPGIVYANPMAEEQDLGFEDAFAIAVNQILNRIKIGRDSNSIFPSSQGP